jgi:predicted SprT family Zn-dependent metalloprotease
MKLVRKAVEKSENEIKVIYPCQCSCGHLYLEKYQFNEVTDEGYIGFCWCGFCRTKLMVKLYKEVLEEGRGK